MMLKSVLSKYARARARARAAGAGAGARTERNFSTRRSESQGRRFSSSIAHSPQDTSFGMPTLFAVTLFGGSFVYMLTDIVNYSVQSTRLKKIKNEENILDDISKIVDGRFMAKRRQIMEKFFTE